MTIEPSTSRNESLWGKPSLPSLTEILQSDPLYLDALIDAQEASRITNVPVASLQNLRTRGGGPPYLKIGASVKYTRRGCLEWGWASGARRSTSDPKMEDAAA